MQVGPIGLVRRSLRESPPSWALLGLSFVGGSVLEVLTDEAQKRRLVNTKRLLGIHELPDVPMFEDSPKKEMGRVGGLERER